MQHLLVGNWEASQKAYVLWNAERKRERRIKRPVIEFIATVSDKE
jgi:hypothetical protein